MRSRPKAKSPTNFKRAQAVSSQSSVALRRENEKISNHRFIDLEVVLATESAISDLLSVREGDILGLIA